MTRLVAWQTARKEHQSLKMSAETPQILNEKKECGKGELLGSLFTSAAKEVCIVFSISRSEYPVHAAAAAHTRGDGSSSRKYTKTGHVLPQVRSTITGQSHLDVAASKLPKQ